jgi:hypothetical protein
MLLHRSVLFHFLLRVMPIVVIFKGRRVQYIIAARLSAFMAKVSRRYNVDRRVGMLSAMLDEVLLAGVTPSPNTTAPLDITGESSLVMLLTHVFRICGLGSKWLIRFLNTTRQILESIGAILMTSLMGADGEGILEARAGPWPVIGIEIDINLMMVIISYVLHQVVLAPKAICTTMKFAVFAWELGFASIKWLQMAVENVEPGKLTTAFAGIGLMLHLLCMATEGSFRVKGRAAFETVKRGFCRDTPVASSMRSSLMSIALARGNECLIASRHFAIVRGMAEKSSVPIELIVERSAATVAIIAISDS